MDIPSRLADERRAWGAVLATILVTLTGLGVGGFSIAPAGVAGPLGGAALLVGVARFYRVARDEPRFAATCTALAQLVLFTAAAGPLSYLAATAARPLQDGLLARADLALGLDWRAYLAWTDARPAIAAVFRFTYDTLMPQLAAALLVLGLAGRHRALRILVWATILSALATIAISGLFPALDCYAAHGIAEGAFPPVDHAGAFGYLADFLGLRDGTVRRIDLRTLEGIITFPSFHAALGALFLWGFWQDRRARWPGLLFEGTMIAGTPIEGGHYFVDVLGGILVAAASLALAARIVAGAGSARSTEPAAAAPVAA